MAENVAYNSVVELPCSIISTKSTRLNVVETLYTLSVECTGCGKDIILQAIKPNIIYVLCTIFLYLELVPGCKV